MYWGFGTPKRGALAPALPFGSEKAVTEIQSVRYWEQQDEQASSAKHKQRLEQIAAAEGQVAGNGENERSHL
jgi:hypothetical protein